MRSIWAVAKNTIKQALRMKTAVVFIILLLILLSLMGINATGDGKLKGRLQTFVSYGLSLISLLLCLLTIVISVYSVTSDIKQKQVYTVLTKPIRRYQFLLGKIVGVVLLDVVLLVIFSVVIYAVIIYMPKLVNADEAELEQVKNEFFTARAGLTPAEVDVSQKLKSSGQLDQLFPNYTYKKIIQSLTNRLKLWTRAAEPGDDLRWEFHDVKPIKDGQNLYIKFKYDVSVNPPDLQIIGGWLIGDLRQLEYGSEAKTPILNFMRRDSIRTFHEIEFPSDVIADDGYLSVSFLNVPVNRPTVIFPSDGLEVLYQADSFGANYIRAVLILLVRLIFLACLGILASSFLSFPVAILLCLAIFTTAHMSAFILESFSFLSEDVGTFYSYFIRPVIHLLPQFDKFNPTKFLIPARLLSWGLLAKAAGLMVCLKGALLLLFALLIFSFREIAKVII